MPNLTATTLRWVPVENIAITSTPWAHDQVALVSQSPGLVLMLLLHYEHLFCLVDHPMLMNALYMQYHLQHQNTHYHVHCPTPDRTLLVQNRQRAPVFHLLHIILLQLRVGGQDLICVSIAKWVCYFITQMPLLLQY
jgi:hypothetical protein